MRLINLPVGISSFEQLRESRCYYVDKTGLIRAVLKMPGIQVRLITRPRRFGKTLGMSMLASFFDIRKDSSALFQGLEIMQDQDLCAKWMNQWPTLFLSFKDIDGPDFVSAKEMLQERIAKLCKTHRYLASSDRVDKNDCKIFEKLADLVDGHPTDAMLKISISLLMQMMRDHFGKPVILLIDEYDVPLAKASSNGYYPEMLGILKSLLSTALKDNDALQFAVVTGCLRIAKESIFTGTNNFVSDTISSTSLNEYFGFTQTEIDRILSDADAREHAGDVKNWYDGYHFGDADVYCPWDVMNYLHDLQNDPEAEPAGYWENTSDNEIIRSFIDYAGESISVKLETLLSGGYILQKIREDLTYDYLHSSEENLWSILYLTGYLTKARQTDIPNKLSRGVAALMIPNAEIREIFENTVQGWFDDHAKTWDRKVLFDAVWAGESDVATEEMSKLLRKTISYHDYREDYYHAFLAGIFAGAGYTVQSNKEHGEGRSDVVVYDSANGRVVIFEAKYVKALDAMESACEAALQQIEEKKYAKEFEENYHPVLCYGIAFYKKQCLLRKK